MKNFLLVSLGILITMSVSAQPSYPTATRLAKVCQVWGYLKYFHTHVNSCSIDWDSVLIAHLEPIKNAADDAAFNSELEAMIAAAGEMPIPITPSDEPNPALLNNLQFFWKDDLVFSDRVKSALDTVRAKFRSTLNCYVKDNSNYSIPNEGWLAFTNENISIPSPEFPSEPYRLLMMFRYWNIINYFFAYRDLMDVNWFTSLENHIPQMIQASSQIDYLLTLRYLSAAIDDAHAIFNSSDFIRLFYGGNGWPQFWMSRIENQYVVTKAWLPGNELQPGDIILSINGHTTEKLVDSLAASRPYCTPASWYRDLVINMLRGSMGSSMVIEAEGPNGRFTTTVKRNISNPGTNYLMSNPYSKTQFVDCGYGYVNMQKLLVSDFDQIYEVMKEAPAIIFDMRNYPNGTAWEIIDILLDGPDTAAILHLPNVKYPGTWQPTPYYEVNGISSNPEPYKGKIILLCDENTQSQAEYSIMKLQTFPNCKVIGTQTAGADGNIATVHLPDTTDLSFTTLEVLYKDGSQTQRKGVRIDTIVGPTIAGLRKGEDEALLAAQDCLTNTSILDPKAEWSFYPNPAHSVIYFKNAPDKVSKIIIRDVTGKIVSESYSTESVQLDQLAAGSYQLFLRTDKGYMEVQKLMIIR
ncbi:MAG: T9SS type A sorting domain-containing protein [Saprospiraceae bacterium]|nr:T9SS type A sorting domain-containing protein [Saprospiraceae bacterium]MBK9631398.1 T9SS type A sorting domain-containing protein [Saprospiraceae bacterium]